MLITGKGTGMGGITVEMLKYGDLVVVRDKTNAQKPIVPLYKKEGIEVTLHNSHKGISLSSVLKEV